MKFTSNTFEKYAKIIQYYKDMRTCLSSNSFLPLSFLTKPKHLTVLLCVIIMQHWVQNTLNKLLAQHINMTLPCCVRSTLSVHELTYQYLRSKHTLFYIANFSHLVCFKTISNHNHYLPVSSAIACCSKFIISVCKRFRRIGLWIISNFFQIIFAESSNKNIKNIVSYIFSW